MIRVLFTGGRGYTDEDVVDRAIDTLFKRYGDFIVIVGDCPTGADRLVGVLCGTFFSVYKADWDTHGKKAGPLRNQAMVDAGPRLCVVFPGGRGTADCERRARKAGIPIWHPADGEPMPELKESP